MTNNNNNAIQKQGVDGLRQYVASSDVRENFTQLMGKEKADQFLMSVVSAVLHNPKLADCEFSSLINACAISHTLDLSINPALGKSHIVPYWNSAQQRYVATWQIGYKGLVQLGLRTGVYTHINTSVVYEGQLVSSNPFTGEFVFQSAKTSDKVIGYVAYIRMIPKEGGVAFEKYKFMTYDEVYAHGESYSKTFKNDKSMWKKDFDGQACKTVLKLLLDKYGMLSSEMEKALRADQGVIKKLNPDGVEVSYDDNPAVDVTAEVLTPDGQSVTVSERSVNVGAKATEQAMKPKAETPPMVVVPDLRPTEGFKEGDILSDARSEDDIKKFAGLYRLHGELSKWTVIRDRLLLIRPDGKISKTQYFKWASEALHNEVVAPFMSKEVEEDDESDNGESSEEEWSAE